MSAAGFHVQRSFRWQSLTLAAREVTRELVAEMQRRGDVELPLPPTGLEAVAHFCGRPWTEVAPAIDELLAVGYVRYDAERAVLVDLNPASPRMATEEPCGEPAGPVVRDHGAVEPASPPRPVEVSPGSREERSDGSTGLSPSAIRARAWRAARKAETQLALFANAPNADRTRPNAFANAESVRIEKTGRSQAFANAPSLSVSSISSSKKERLALDPEAMPNGWADHAATLRTDLPAERVARSWRRFALAKTGTLTSWPLVQARWESWLERERVADGAGEVAPRKPPRTAPGDAPAPYHREFPAASSAAPRLARCPGPDPVALAGVSRLGAVLQAASAS